MDMIGHQRPRAQAIGLTVFGTQHLFDLRGDIRAAQPALAVAAVEPSFQFAFANGLITFSKEEFPLAPPG
jgi:hypothetical protein